VSLGWDIAAHLPGLRAEAVSRFTETVTFFTVTRGEDPVTLQPIDVETVIEADVAARLRSAARDPRDVPIAGQEPVVSKLTLSVGVGTVRVGPSVFVRVTASSSDPGLVGVKVRTTDFPTMGQVTAWRYPVEQVS
jgi:hypothetical protein